jgi:hypothetical protein
VFLEVALVKLPLTLNYLWKVDLVEVGVTVTAVTKGPGVVT